MSAVTAATVVVSVVAAVIAATSFEIGVTSLATMSFFTGSSVLWKHNMLQLYPTTTDVRQ